MTYYKSKDIISVSKPEVRYTDTKRKIPLILMETKGVVPGNSLVCKKCHTRIAAMRKIIFYWEVKLQVDYFLEPHSEKFCKEMEAKNNATICYE